MELQYEFSKFKSRSKEDCDHIFGLLSLQSQDFIRIQIEVFRK